LAIGSGLGQIGMLIDPNVECRGPQALAFFSDSELAVLDSVNRRILLLSTGRTTEIPLPPDASEPIDLVVAKEGFAILEDSGRITLLRRDGQQADRASIRPPISSPRNKLTIDPAGNLRIDDSRGGYVSSSLSISKIGGLLDAPGPLTDYQFERVGPRSIKLARGPNAAGPAAIEISSERQLANAQVVAILGDGGAIVRIEEFQQLPIPRAFVRIARTGASGTLASAAFLTSDAGSCAPNREIAVAPGGMIAHLRISAGPSVSIEALALGALGSSPPEPPAQDSVAPVAADESVFQFLERMNGTTSVATVASAIKPITRSEILARAKAALGHRWVVGKKNYEHQGIVSLCQPANGAMWRRPPYLTNMIEKEVGALPYRWGGYHRKLDDFDGGLANGRLAGDVCTCRNREFNYCIVDQAIGLDCSGFVSHAWDIQYLTTASLAAFATIKWTELTAGDAVNHAGSHVMLVSSVQDTPRGRVIHVINSSVSCGNVCEKTFGESDLREQGYKPIRRPSTAD